MAERNCKKCFHYKACKDVASHSGYRDINYTESQCEHFIPTTDVVPKSEVVAMMQWVELLKTQLAEAKQEVAREIFEEIEKLPKHMLEQKVNMFGSYPNSVMKGAMVALSDVAELKKKYTEGESK